MSYRFNPPGASLQAGLVPNNTVLAPNYGTHSQLTIAPGDRLSINLWWGVRKGQTMTHFVLIAGAGTDVDSLDLRIETQGTDGPTGTLVDPAATGSIASVGGSTGQIVIPINGGAGVVINDENPCVVLEVSGVVGEVKMQYCADYNSVRNSNAPTVRLWDGLDWDAVATVGLPVVWYQSGGENFDLAGYPFDYAITGVTWDSGDANPMQGAEFAIDFNGKVGGFGGWFYLMATGSTVDVIVLLNGAQVATQQLLPKMGREKDGSIFALTFPEVAVADGDTVTILFAPWDANNVQTFYFDTSFAEVAEICARYKAPAWVRGTAIGTLSTVANRAPVVSLLMTEIDTGAGGGGGGGGAGPQGFSVKGMPGGCFG